MTDIPTAFALLRKGLTAFAAGVDALEKAMTTPAEAPLPQPEEPAPHPAPEEPAPLPDPPPRPEEPAPQPAPDPAPAQPVLPDWRATVDGYAARSFAGPVASSPLSVQDGRELLVDGWRHKSPPSTIQRCVEIYPDGELTLRNFEILGSDGQAENKVGVITRTTEPDKAGRLRALEDGTIDAMSSDWLKIAGLPGAEQSVRRVYFGPQWATSGSAAHSDFITFLGVLGDILIKGCRFDRVLAPGRRVAGMNNWLRIVPNQGSSMKGANRIRIRETVVYSDQFPSFLIQRTRYSDGVPFLDLQDVDLPVSRIGMQKVFYPGFDMSLLRWVNVRDTYTREPIPAPAGAVTV